MRIYVKDLTPDDIDILFNICCRECRGDIFKEAMKIKRRWIEDLIDKYGSIAKIGFIDDNPVAQILYYPEEAIPFIEEPRKNVAVIQCIYNPFPEHQRKGVAKALVNKLIEEAYKGGLFGGKLKIKAFVATPFETGEHFSQIKFFEKMGFKKVDGYEYQYVIEEPPPKPLKLPDYIPRDRDVGRAYIFYTPSCEYSLPFAYRIRQDIEGIAERVGVDIDVNILNTWEYPDEFRSKGLHHLIVNRIPIRGFYGTNQYYMELYNAIKSLGMR